MFYRWNNIRTFSRLHSCWNGLQIAILIDPGVLMVIISQSIIIIFNPYIFPFCLTAISIELLNTAIELTCDYICQNEYNLMIRDIKDIASTATFITQIIPIILIIINTFIL